MSDVNFIQKPIILDETGKLIADNISAQSSKIEEIINKYSPFVGSTTNSNGSVGLVPAPMANEITQFLCSDGTWKDISSYTSLDTEVSSVSTKHPLILHSTSSAGANGIIHKTLFTSGVNVVPSSKTLNVEGSVNTSNITATSGTINTLTSKGITNNGTFTQNGNTIIVGNFSSSAAGDFGGALSATSLTTGQVTSSKVVCSGEVISNTHTRVAASNGIPDLIIRNDGSNAYLLFSDYANGSWNALRPLTINISTGNLTSSGTFTATKVFNAVWNDYAEFFPRGEETEAGDFVALSLDCDEEVYVKASKETSKSVGIHSDSFGHLIGGENCPEGEDFVEYNLPRFIPVGLVGRVKAKIVGEIKKGDFIVISDIPGVGRKFDKGLDSCMDIIGMACESSNDKDIKRIKIKLGN